MKSYSTAFAKAYSKALGNTVNQQLISSADLIADLWYTAWVDGGKPELTEFLKEAYTKEEKKAFCKEKKLFKKNSLLKEKKLLSRKDQAGSTE